VLGGTGHPANIQCLVKQILEHPPRPMSVGIGQCGFVRGLFDPKWRNFPRHRIIRHIFQADSWLGQIGKKAWLRMSPAAETFGVPLSIVTKDKIVKRKNATS
jgi:hypothetical protein